jgi:hypothetical protein
MVAESKSSSKHVFRNRSILFSLVIGYLVLQVVLVGAMHKARDWASKNFSGPTAQLQWDEWVEAARRQSEGNGPVQRRVPKSKEPPVLVLLRDHFPVCVFGTWLFSTALYVTFTFLGWGLLGGRSGG